jgi:DNA recombination protein RmuC
MEINLIAGFVIGALLSGVIVWFFMRQGIENARGAANAESNIRLAVASEKYAAIENLKNELVGQAEISKIEIQELRQSKTELAVDVASEQQKNKNISEQLQAAKVEINALNQQLEGVKNQLQKSQQDLIAAVATLESERLTLATSSKLLDDTKSALTEQLRQIVQQIPEKISEENKVKLDDVLKPFRERLQDLQKTVIETSQSGVEKNAELSQQIKSLSDQSLLVSQSAVNLTNALKGSSKTQGAWGELILDRTLELTGLRKGEDYVTQSNVKDDLGANFRPDVVVNLPDGKHIVIDSKVSIKDYDLYTSAQDATQKQAYAKAHLESIKKHIADLSGKAYESKVDNTPSFTVMFIPIESAFALALDNDSNLFQLALRAGIVFATPTTLLAMLRTIEFGWRQERQQKNVDDIIKKTTDLYDKFVLFYESLSDVESRLSQAQAALAKSKDQLQTGTGSLVKRVDAIRLLGLKPKKSLPTHLLDESVDVAIPLIENNLNES